ncbi:MAG: TrbG/VirB9 family P-type conjugative transfer protein [Brevundimonas sp.]
MDPRRLLIPAAGWLLLSSCAILRPLPVAAGAAPAAPGKTLVADLAVAVAAAEPRPVEPARRAVVAPVVEKPIPPAPAAPSQTERAYAADKVNTEGANARPAGRLAIAAANRAAMATAREAGFIGGVQMFDWAPGRVFEVWTAPLRVTTLTLAPGETLVSKAAGDTIRWQLAEVSSGSGARVQTHILLKPLQRGLETNLVLTTNKRVYLIDLKSGPVESFNPAVAWDAAAVADPPQAVPALADLPPAPPPPASTQVVLPQGEPDGRYRIEPQGRKARWTPTSVFNDGRRTFITFDPDLQVDEAPALFVIAPDGERQLVNYRQVGGLFVVDRVFDRAELRLGDRRPQVVVLRRLAGAVS